MGRYGRSQEALPVKTRRVWLLIKNEVLHGPKDVILVMAVILPVLLSLFVNLAFGNIFTARAKIGIFDEGRSALVGLLQLSPSLLVKTYTTQAQLENAAARGAVDVGIAIPLDFDRAIESGQVGLKAYVWGESSPKNRTLIPVVLAGAVREIEGTPLPVKIETVTLGGSTQQPWSQRLLPLPILMAVFFGGLMIPASSLINEKIQRTLEALNVTPLTVREIFIAKGLIAIFLAFLMGLLTLLISGGANSALPATMLMLFLGAVLAAEFGLLAGALIKDMNTLYTFWKFGGLLLFGPAVVYLFPAIPQWIGYLFPTYYVIRPIVDLSVNGAGFKDIVLFAGILLLLLVVLFLLINKIVQQLSTRALRIQA
jgi:ABC-2 type transport system permease protein